MNIVDNAFGKVVNVVDCKRFLLQIAKDHFRIQKRSFGFFQKNVDQFF